VTTSTKKLQTPLRFVGCNRKDNRYNHAVLAEKFAKKSSHDIQLLEEFRGTTGNLAATSKQIIALN